MHERSLLNPFLKNVPVNIFATGFGSPHFATDFVSWFLLCPQVVLLLDKSGSWQIATLFRIIPHFMWLAVLVCSNMTKSVTSGKIQGFKVVLDSKTIPRFYSSYYPEHVTS